MSPQRGAGLSSSPLTHRRHTNAARSTRHLERAKALKWLMDRGQRDVAMILGLIPDTGGKS